MGFIPRQAHAAMDYMVGALLLISPFLFGFADGGIAQQLPMAVGAITILYSLLTRYELGLVRVIPFPVHIVFDGIGGFLLLVSPFVFGFAETVYLPHVLFGLLELVVAGCTRIDPEAGDLAGRPT